MSATSYPAGDQIPITRTFVVGTVTTAVGLIGQVLENGQTNWVGVDQGNADYLLTASAANAVETTLADGNTYYYSSGSAPAGYLYSSGLTFGTASSGAGTAMTTGSAAAGTMGSSAGSSSQMTTTYSSSSQTGAASTSATKTSSARKLSSGAICSIGLAFVGALSLMA